MKHLFFDGVSGTSKLTFTRPCIADADITVEGSGIWQFGFKMDDTINREMFCIFDKDNPLQVKYNKYSYYYLSDDKKYISSSYINEFDSYVQKTYNTVTYFFCFVQVVSLILLHQRLMMKLLWYSISILMILAYIGKENFIGLVIHYLF